MAAFFEVNMEKWVVKAKKADFFQIASDFQIDPVIARLIRNRDVIGNQMIKEYLHGDLHDIASAFLMKDMKNAVAVLCEAMRSKKKIRIIGDYDIDGIMATYILLQGLTRMGAEVDIQIPDRIVDGYGLNESLVREAADDQVDLILTCDNGIAAKEQIAVAKELGMQVIVTDHHEVPYKLIEGEKQYFLPSADAVINPKQEDCRYPFKGLCGAAVAWKLICALYEECKIAKEETEEFLEYVAIATIGDVMMLQGENRILVKEGLQRLHRTKNLGLQALCEVNQIETEKITPYHIGFVLGPCLNASGRLDTAKRALEMLCATTREEASRLAGDLKMLNDSRKAMTLQNTDAAIELVEASPQKEDRVLVVYLPNCHESLAGIIAGRLKERYYRPTFVLTKTADGIKGSGRSIEAYSMYEELVKCSHLLTKFGGHPMAAGISLKEENLEALRTALNQNCTLTQEELCRKITIDMEMPIAYVTKDLVVQLEQLQPFGMGNEKPLFAKRNLKVCQVRVLGREKNVARAKILDENGYAVSAVYFGEAEKFSQYAEKHDNMMLTYYPVVQSYRGREELVLTIQNYR